MTVRPWQAEIVVTADVVKAVVSSQFPELADQKVDHLGSGWDNDAFLVGHYVFRFPRRMIAVEALPYELAALRLLPADLPLDVPRISHLGKPCDAYPHAFFAYPMLDGQLASDGTSNRGDSQEDAATLGGFLRAVHQTPAHISETVRGDTMRKADHPYRLGKIKDAFETIEQSHLPAPKAALIAASERLAETPMAATATLVHGDLYSRHLVLDATGGLKGVIDWGDAHLGDPAQDLSVAYTYFTADTESSFWEAYGGVDPDTKSRAMFKALFYGAVLTDFGVGNSDRAIFEVGRHSILRVLESLS